MFEFGQRSAMYQRSITAKVWSSTAMPKTPKPIQVALRHFAHGCERVYSADRWLLTGEAGVFTDPFYSPGSDFIAMSNELITDLIIRDRRGEDISTLRTEDRARAGIGFVPQGREVFPLLSVKENLETGFAPLARKERYVPDELFDLFPVLKSMLGRRGGDLSGGQQQQLAIARALVTRPKLLVLDEPTEGIQPSIIKDIGRAIDYLRSKGDMAIVLVEQYFDFARDLADTMFVMDRGEVVLSGAMKDLDANQVQRLIQV
jgi:urea transport system ATP-binding protein